MTDKISESNKIDKHTSLMGLTAVILIIALYLINQLLGYGNIAMAQQVEGVVTTYLSSALTGLGTGFELVALIKLLNRPVQSILFTLLSQVVLMLSDVAQGYSIREAFGNNGVFEVYCSVVAIGMLIWLWSKYAKGSKTEDSKLSLRKYIAFNREPIRLPMWAIFSVACICLSLVAASANKLEVGLWSNTIQFRVYVGLTLFIPTLTTLAMYTASNLVYYLYGSMMVLKIVAVFRLALREEFRWTILAISLIQLIVYVYSLVRYIRSRHKNENKLQ